MAEAIASPPTCTDGASVDAAVAATVEAFGGLHVLYNNAGVSLGDDDGPSRHARGHVGARRWTSTSRACGCCCKAGIPAMLDSGGGSIINVASFVAHLGAATPQLAYTTSKGAVLSMTREIAVIYARQGIRANALCPGPVLTPLLAKYLSDEEKRQRRLVHIPMGRFGEADEMVKGALFLASDESSLHDRPVPPHRRRHHRRLHHPRVSRSRSSACTVGILAGRRRCAEPRSPSDDDRHRRSSCSPTCRAG